MAFDQFKKLPEDVEKKLPFLGTKVYYLFRNSAGKMLRGFLYEISDVNMDKAWKRLKGEEGEIVSGDKVFILPNCRIPMFKLTDYLKGVGAVQTADVIEASKIIGHERVKEEVMRQALGSTMLMEIVNPFIVSGFKVSYWKDPVEQKIQAAGFIEYVSNFEDTFEDIETLGDMVLSKVAPYDSYNFASGAVRRYVTPTGAWILYNHILKKIPVLSEESVYQKIGKPITLDEEIWVSINDMLGSKDEESQRAGAEILANCDIQPSLFWIWKLSRQHQQNVSKFSSFKNVRLFMKMVKWYDIHLMNHEEFIEHLYNKRLLTKEYFSDLVMEAVKPYGKALQSTLFSMVVTPSDMYKEFSDGQIFKFNKEPEDSQVEVEEEEEEIDD